MKTISTFRIFSGNHKLPFLTLLLFAIFQQSYGQQKHIVEVSNNKFTPQELTVEKGDTVEWRNIEGYHNVNGTQSTYPSNPESFGNSPGNGWTYSHVFNTAGMYEYHCNPHVGLGMTGKIEVKEDSDDNSKYMLTVNFSNMDPHNGQVLKLALVDKDSGEEVERTSETVSSNFSVEVSGLEKDHSYFINFFSDHNGNNAYDTPPGDHAWQLELDNVLGDTTLNFMHNTSFANIMWENKLTVNFMSMNPHVGQNLWLGVIEKSSGQELYTTTVTVENDFEIEIFGIENGKSYNIDFYSDHNQNGEYDAPPTDHAWRMELNNVEGDTALNFTHNTSFTDIFVTTSADQTFVADAKFYPNPAKDKVTLELNKNTSSVYDITIFDISGRQQYKLRQSFRNRMEMDIRGLNQGIYFIEVRDGTDREVFKLIKQ